MWAACSPCSAKTSSAAAMGTLYNYFEDRERLLAGLLDARRAEMIAGLDEALLANAGTPFEDQLRGVLRALFEHFEAHRPFMRILVQAEQGQPGGAIASTTSKPLETMRALTERFEKVIRVGVRKKVLRAEDADELPALLMGIVRGLVMVEWKLKGRSLVGREDRIVDFFLRGAGA